MRTDAAAREIEKARALSDSHSDISLRRTRKLKKNSIYMSGWQVELS